MLQALADSGTRITAHRRLIASIIDDLETHADAFEIHQLARKRSPSINQATVYRTLALLKSKGLIRDHRFDQDHGHFEPAIRSDHHHAICQTCGAVKEFELELTGSQRLRLTSQTGYHLVSARIEFVGICSDCRQGNKDFRPP